MHGQTDQGIYEILNRKQVHHKNVKGVAGVKNVIVTGANGFIGSAVVKELLKAGYRVYAMIHNGHKDQLQESPLLHCISCDLQSLKVLSENLPQQRYDCMYHFAWAGSAGNARGDTVLQMQNVQWMIDLLQAAGTLRCPRIICSGSIVEHETMEAVYGSKKVLGTGNIYGAGKIAAHIMGMAVAYKMGIELVWGSITNAYGPGEKSPRLINTTIQKCLKGISPEFTSGTQNYDFVYIDDVARAFRLIGEKGKPYKEYLIGSSAAKPLKDFLLEMQETIAPDVPFLFGRVPFSGIDLPLTAFDGSATERDTAFKAEISFQEGCRRTAEWWRKQEMIP